MSREALLPSLLRQLRMHVKSKGIKTSELKSFASVRT